VSFSPQRLLRRAAAAPRVTWKLARLGRPRRMVLFGPVSLGDDLLCTAIFREWRQRGERNLWMMSRHPALFAGNPDIDRVVPIDDYHARALRALGREVVQPYYVSLRPDDDEGAAPVPTRHFIAQMCALAGIRGEIALRPYLHLGDAERAAGALAPRQVVIHSSGRTRGFASANKEWVAGRFQAVVDAARDRYDFVQLGSVEDPPLAGARDLRGRTSLRESAGVVAASRAVVCQEGFLMHLARAVDVRAVVVYGGALDPAITGYRANENLFSAVPCAPCWRRNRCDFEHRCMTGIGVADVVAALDRAAARPGAPLPVDTAFCA
jgi:hypothetical protein